VDRADRFYDQTSRAAGAVTLTPKIRRLLP
jgi:hypothetical protein